MKIYLDVCCLNRPFDDQQQARIRMESEAIALIFTQIDAGHWRYVSSQAVEIELAATVDLERRRRVGVLLPSLKDRVRLTARIFNRAEALVQHGFRPADALHIAAAEASQADIMLTCDDRLARRARRLSALLTVRVANPLQWIREIEHAPNT